MRTSRSTTRSIRRKASRDGHAHCRRAFRAHVAHPLTREPRHGASLGCAAPRASHHRLAARSAAAGQAGFHLPSGEGRGVCGWLLLARLPASRTDAENPRRLLDGEARAELAARPSRDTRFAEIRLDGLAGMGVRFGALARRAHDGAHRPRTCRTETKTMNSRAPAGVHDFCGRDPGVVAA